MNEEFLNSLSDDERKRVAERLAQTQDQVQQEILDSREQGKLDALRAEYQTRLSAIGANRNLDIHARIRAITDLKASYREKGLPVF